MSLKVSDSLCLYYCHQKHCFFNEKTLLPSHFCPLCSSNSKHPFILNISTILRELNAKSLTNISIGFGSVRLGENQIAEVLFNDQWVPICGHVFWDNNVGYNKFCQEKGFKSGKKAHRVPLNADGLRIGLCQEGDTFPNCTSAKNNKMVVGDDQWQCHKGKDAGLVIDCKG